MRRRTYYGRELKEEFAARINEMLGIRVKTWWRLPGDDLRKIYLAIEDLRRKLESQEEAEEVKVGGTE